MDYANAIFNKALRLPIIGIGFLIIYTLIDTLLNVEVTGPLTGLIVVLGIMFFSVYLIFLGFLCCVSLVLLIIGKSIYLKNPDKISTFKGFVTASVSIMVLFEFGILFFALSVPEIFWVIFAIVYGVILIISIVNIYKVKPSPYKTIIYNPNIQNTYNNGYNYQYPYTNGNQYPYNSGNHYENK